MPQQRLTQSRQIYCVAESNSPGPGEGVDPLSITGSSALLVSNLTLNIDRAFLPRQVVGQLGNLVGKMGAQTDPGLSFAIEFRPGVGTTNVPAYSALLENVFGPVSTDSASTTISTVTNASEFNLTSTAGFHAGNAIAVEMTAGVSEVAWISPTWNGSNPVQLSEPLSTAPSGGENVTSSSTYKPQNANHGSLTFYVSLDGSGGTDVLVMTGCKGSVKLDVPAPGAIPMLTFNFKAMAWYYKTVSALTPTYDSTTPQTGSRFKVDGTETQVKLANWDLGQAIARKTTQNASLEDGGPNFGTFAQVVTNRMLKGTMQVYDMDDSQIADWAAETEYALSQQFGSSVNAIAAYQIPKAQRTKVAYGDDNGLTTDQIDFQGNYASGADEIRIAFC